MRRGNKITLIIWLVSMITAFQVGKNSASVKMIVRIHEENRQEQEQQSYGMENANSSNDVSSGDLSLPDEDDAWTADGIESKYSTSGLNPHDVCPNVLADLGAESLSTSHIWEKLKPKILNATYFYPSNLSQQLEPKNMMQPYQNWIDDIFSFYTADRLRRSIGNPAPPKHMMRLIRKIQEIQKYNSDLETSSQDDAQKKNLRILVLGGSVTAGHECHLPNFLGLNKKREKSIADIAHKECAWAGRLEHLLNGVFFGGDRVVTVDNIASGGQTSEWGAIVLENRLFHDPDKLPDVVISAFSANEAVDPNRAERVLYDLMQDFIAAANNLQTCDDHSPLIIMADDFYGDSPYKALRQTGYVLMSSTWYNIMAVNYASVVKYKVFAEQFSFTGSHPLTGSQFTTHLGLPSHLGMAWTVLFNIVDAFVNVCNDFDIGIVHNEEEKYDPPSYWGATIAHFEREKEYESVQDTGFIGDNDLLPTLQRGEPPTKHIGRIGRGRPDSANVVGEHLAKNIAGNDAYCSSSDAENSSSIVKGCSYAWISHQLPSPDFVTKEQLAEEMDKVVISNNGWIADGDPVVNPRTGWYTYNENSSFSMKIENVAIDTDFVLIYSMKSYGPNFIGSRLNITTEVLRGSNRDSNDMNTPGHGLEPFEIEGYHTTRSSVHFPHKIPISGGAKVGDTVIFHAKLTGGSHFKIAGIAFCSATEAMNAL